ncbi:MAG TPA: GspE/PulE family protein [Chthoniobacterales bacterium]|nr:GspE/PulE family protein [Chthoniobacterales bacterium]
MTSLSPPNTLGTQRGLLAPTSPQVQPNSEHFVLDLLEEAGLVTRPQIDDACSKSNGAGGAVDLLIREGVVSEADVSRSLVAHTQVGWVDLSTRVVPPEIIGEIRAEDARRFNVIPVGFGESGLIVAVSDPLDIHTVDNLRFSLQRQIELVCASPEQIRLALIKYYGAAKNDRDGPLQRVTTSLDHDLEIAQNGDLNVTDEADAPIICLVSMLLGEAHRVGASDIHLEPLDKKFRVRFRIDGVLQEMPAPPKRLQSAIVSRLKIMTGSMSIAEKRLPQDGRIQVKLSRKPIDLRVSTIPTNHGESVVMRLLDKSNLMLGLPELGFFPDDQETFERLIRLPDGILLVTGPTGSGKTSTLYSCLNFINKPDRKIITVEDPIEYQMNGINQVPVNAEIGMTFPVALRSILRQAPNVIMIGEIRDRETATIATNASLTGHLVFSTLHTNDATSAVARLVDIGVQPFLVASSMRAIMAQRLIRRLCLNCKQPGELTETELRALNLAPEQLGEAEIMKPAGCEECRQTGYKGRMGIFEILVIDDELRHMINNRRSTLQLRQRARELGMRTLREDGVRKVLAGLTSAEEVISVTLGDVS